MKEARRNSVAFFALGVVAFVTGTLFWAVWGRADAMVLFACAAVLFAGAWVCERASKSKREN
ncbi:hypothetical protein [Streptomyces thermoalcalitolerans]|uniref:Uncharacterized protein n=1 Tax=Streptomyces thermoalcalitolerans TaxID=65605 RepID=A0ABN1P7C9_9ACTN